jgi:hypothetical protein
MHFKQDITQQANEGRESLQTKKTGFNSSGTVYFLWNTIQTRDSSATEAHLSVYHSLLLVVMNK